MRIRLVDIGLDRTVCHDILQVVVKDDNYEWGQSASLDEYKIEDAEIDMDYGTRLSRCGIKDPADNSKSKYFVWTFLQAIVDGRTKRLLLKDLDACLSHAEDSAAHVASRLSFRSFVEHMFTIDKPISLDFWRTRMEGVEHVHLLSIPLLGNALSQSSALSTHSSQITHTVHFTQHSNINPNAATSFAAFAHVAYALALSHISNFSKDVFFISKRSGRQILLPGLSNIMGPCTTHTPFCLHLTPHETISAILHRAQHDMIKGIPHEPYGLQALLETLGEGYCDSLLIPQAAETDVFAISVHDANGETVLQPDEQLSSMESMALAFVLEVRPKAKGEMLLVAEYDTKRVSEDRVWQVLRAMGAYLGVVARAAGGDTDEGKGYKYVSVVDAKVAVDVELSQLGAC